MLASAGRPTSWDVPLFLHVGGAMVVVGALVAALTALALAWPEGGAAPVLRRIAFRTLVFAAIPAYIVMRVAAQWVFSKEGYDAKGAPSPSWLGAGYIIAEPALVVLIAATVVAWRATKRERGGALVGVATVLAGVVLVALLVAMWAMTTKPD